MSAREELTLAQPSREALVQRLLEAETLVAERDLAVRELEHRVMNQLQFALSCLAMAERRCPEGPARDELELARRRIDAIARCHRLMSSTNDTRAGTSFALHLEELCAALGDGLASAQGARVSISLETDPNVTVDPARALPVTLVVTELVINAAKHAFPDGRTGTVQVVLEREANHVGRLHVHDDGCGLGASPQPDNQATGKGTGLVAALVRQVGGSLLVDADSTGTRYTLQFPTVDAAGT